MYSCRNEKTPYVQKHKDWCEKLRSKVYPLLTDNFPIMSSAVSKCFRNVIIGTGPLTDHCRDETVHGREPVNPDCNHGGAQVFKEFYCNVLRRMKKDPPKKVMNQLLVIKEGPRFSRSMSEIVVKVIDTMGLGTYNISFTEIVDISRRTVEEQVDVLEGAKVVICPVGSISFLAFFLRPGATLVLLYENEALDHNLFSHFGHIRVVYIRTIDLNEFETTLRYAIKTSFVF